MLLQRTGHTADGAPRTNTRHKDIDLPVRVSPYFLTGRTFVHGGVRGIIELLEDDGAGRSVTQGFGLGNGTRHTFGTRCQHDLRTERLQQRSRLIVSGMVRTRR